MDLNQRHKTTKRVTLVGAFTNVILSFLQIVFGWITHSQALIADGLHTLSDLVSDFLVLFASSKAKEKADENHPYGHARIETLASVVLGLLLAGVGFSIGAKGILSIINDTLEQPETLALAFAALAIVSKELLYRYTIHFAKKIHSSLLESNAYHHRSDVASSLVVFAGIGGQLLGIPYFDIAAAFIVALMIIRMGFKLALKAIKELIDTALEPELVNQIRSLVLKVKGVYGIHQLRTRSMGGLGYIDIDIEVNAKITVSEGHYIASCVEQAIKQNFKQIFDVKIHIDPYGEDGSHPSTQQLPSREDLLISLYEAWSTIHDSDILKNINIHYRSNSIEIDLILPLELVEKDNKSLISDLKTSTLSIPLIDKLNIYFA